MWQITFEGRAHREDDLTIDMAERIEELVGESWRGTGNSGVGPGEGVEGQRVPPDGEAGRRRLADDVCRRKPSEGGRPLDAYVVFFGRPPYCWPPSVTKSQKLRDLRLLLEARAAEG
jgi:hypothetical protein